MTKASGWKCMICGKATQTRRYAVVAWNVTGYKVDSGNWNRRRICDACVHHCTDPVVLTATITELREAQPYQWNPSNDPYYDL